MGYAFIIHVHPGCDPTLLIEGGCVKTLTIVAVGGAFGALARYGMGGWVHGWAGAWIPWGTLGVNVLGALLIGFGVGYLEGVPASPELRALVTVGFLASFTTFSTYAYETVALLREGAWLRAGLYSLGGLMVGIAAVVVGLGLADVVLRTRG